MAVDPRSPSPSARCDTVFLGAQHEHHERRTWWVVGLTAVTMAVEILGGAFYGSMALAADGWHMSTHVVALSITALAYRYARRHADDPRFVFGTGKVGELAGFTSAMGLALVGVLIGWESLQRLVEPRAISFGEATVLAVLGLVVNLISAALLSKGSEHAVAHRHESDGEKSGRAVADMHAEHEHHHHDSNLRAAYLHVIADALTSILAIVALLAGRFLGWIWLDPAIGVVGALVIVYWSWTLIRSASHSLLDASANAGLLAAIAERLEAEGDEITDLHLWRVGPGHNALIVAIASERPAAPGIYKQKLADLPGLSHITIEVNARRP